MMVGFFMLMGGGVCVMSNNSTDEKVMQFWNSRDEISLPDLKEFVRSLFLMKDKPRIIPSVRDKLFKFNTI